MTTLFQINALLRFLIEMLTLILLIFLGLEKYQFPFNLMIGILVPVIIYVIWSIYMAPLSPHRARLWGRITIEVVIFGLCASMLTTRISGHAGLVYGVLVSLNAIVAHIGVAVTSKFILQESGI